MLLKQIANEDSNIVIVNFDVNSSYIPSDLSRYTVETFPDDCACISGLLSIIGKYVYLIVSISAGEYIIPLVYEHQCIERIYIYCSDDNQLNAVWINDFPKIRDCWIDLNILINTVYNDIKSITMRSPSCSNIELMDRCHNQMLNKSLGYATITLNFKNIEKYSNVSEQLCIGLFHCDTPALFRMESQQIPLLEFSNKQQCLDYVNSADTICMFLIISGGVKSIVQAADKILPFKQIYTLYLFTPFIDRQTMDATAQKYINIGRLFDDMDLLLKCLTSDIKFYSEQPLYRSTISLFDVPNNTRNNGVLQLTDKQKQFITFQLSVDALQSASDVICHNQNLCARCSSLIDSGANSADLLSISEMDTDKIFSWFINSSSSSVIINSFRQESSIQNLLDLQYIIKNIDRRFTSSSFITSSSTVYRVQLISKEDLQLIGDNRKSLIAFHTYLLASKDLLTIRTIAREAVDRGLSVVVLQIEISAPGYVLQVDDRRSMFRFGSVFSIRSVDLGPDRVWYAQLKYADSNFQLIKQRLQFQMKIEHLSWLTLGNYLGTLGYFDEGKSYYNHLIKVLPRDDRALPSVYNNMGLILAGSNDVEKAIEYLDTARKLLPKNSSTIEHDSKSIPLKPLEQGDEIQSTINSCTIYEKMAEIYLSLSKCDDALKYYRKALESTSDLFFRVHLEQKIRNILSLLS